MNGILKMPRVGETMEQGRLTAWLVEPGQPFRRGDPILEVETDKTLVEYPALGNGILLKSLVDIGDMVDVGSPIAEITMSDGPDWLGDNSIQAKTEIAEPVPELAVALTTDLPDNNATKVRSHNQRLRATPLARRMAEQANINISSIVGTGRRGRVERVDIEAALIAAPADIQSGFGIAWCDKGVADGSPVLFIHGFAADHTAWSGLQAQMSRSGYRTLAVDLPSHGAASQHALGLSELAPPVIAFAEHSIIGQPVHVVAHSMGAHVAVILAQSVPVASLSLIAPAGVGKTINTDFLQALAKPRDVASVARTLRCLTHKPVGLSHSAHEAIFDTLSKGRIADIARSFADANGQLVDIRHELANIAQKIPVSLLLGHRDQIISWSQALDISPLITCHHFPDAGHMPHWEEQAAVQCILERQILK